MRIKIVSGGKGANTKIFDADTGEQIPNATKVTWSVEARGLARCTLELIDVPVEIETEVEE